MTSWLVYSSLEQVVQVRALGYSVVFLGKMHYSPSTSLHPGVQMSTSRFYAGITLQRTSIPSGGSRNTPSHFM